MRAWLMSWFYQSNPELSQYRQDLLEWKNNAWMDAIAWINSNEIISVKTATTKMSLHTHAKYKCVEAENTEYVRKC